MDIFSKEKEEKDKIRAESVIKYQSHFQSFNHKQSLLCGLSAVGGIALATKYITPHAGFRLSMGATFYITM